MFFLKFIVWTNFVEFKVPGPDRGASVVYIGCKNIHIITSKYQSDEITGFITYRWF